MSHPIEGLIFDCDGTLINSMPVHWLAWQEVTQRHGVDFPEDRFYSLGGVPSWQIIQMLSDEQGVKLCLLYTSPSPRDKRQSRMPSSA